MPLHHLVLEHWPFKNWGLPPGSPPGSLPSLRLLQSFQSTLWWVTRRPLIAGTWSHSSGVLSFRPLLLPDHMHTGPRGVGSRLWGGLCSTAPEPGGLPFMLKRIAGLLLQTPSGGPFHLPWSSAISSQHFKKHWRSSWTHRFQTHPLPDRVGSGIQILVQVILRQVVLCQTSVFTSAPHEDQATLPLDSHGTMFPRDHPTVATHT